MSSPVVPIRKSYDRVSIPSLDAICNPIIIGFLHAKISNRFKKSEWTEKYAVIGRRSLILYPDMNCIGKQKGAKLFELVKVERQELKIKQKFVHSKELSIGRKRSKVDNVITLVKLRLPDEDIAKKCAAAMNYQADQAKEAKRRIEEQLANELEFPYVRNSLTLKNLGTRLMHMERELVWTARRTGTIAKNHVVNAVSFTVRLLNIGSMKRNYNGQKSIVVTRFSQEKNGSVHMGDKVSHVMGTIKAFQKEREREIAHQTCSQTAQPQDVPSGEEDDPMSSTYESENEDESCSSTSSSSSVTYYDRVSTISTIEQEESWWTKFKAFCFSGLSLN
ncbi:hypothetical protein D918_06762 [Trichuris suis]|nr:hypothetical protein D918_06762 [Trichuris suis]